MAYSAVPEVIGPGGVCVPIVGLVDNPWSHFWAIVDEGAFGAAVEKLINSRKARRELGGRGVIHVGANFTWDRAAEQFTSLLSRVEVAA